jgi:hypothetical protein
MTVVSNFCKKNFSNVKNFLNQILLKSVFSFRIPTTPFFIFSGLTIKTQFVAKMPVADSMALFALDSLIDVTANSYPCWPRYTVPVSLLHTISQTKVC